jgi:hypothetical protein
MHKNDYIVWMISLRHADNMIVGKFDRLLIQMDDDYFSFSRQGCNDENGRSAPPRSKGRLRRSATDAIGASRRRY